MSQRIWRLTLLCLSLLIAACNSSSNHNDPAPDPENPPTEPGEPGEPEEPGEPGEPGEPEPEPRILLDETFEGDTLPEGWAQYNGVDNAAYVQDGSLFIDGRADNYTATAVTLPAELGATGDYRIDAEFTIASANTASRWVGFIYRAGQSFEPYYQMAIRQGATASNGTELAFRSGGWTILEKAPYSEAIDAEKTYNVTIIVQGGRVQQFINGELLENGELDSQYSQGGLALQAAGTLFRVDRVTVTEQLDALPNLPTVFTVNEPETGVAMAPTLVRTAQADTDLSGLQASNVLFTLDKNLNLLDDNDQVITTLADYLDQEPVNAIPTLRIRDADTITTLSALVTERNLMDLTLLSNDADLLAAAREAMPMARAALDLSGASLGNTRQDLLGVVHATNRAGAKIALLPTSLVTRDSVAYLQRMLITVWAGSANTSATRAAELLTTGVNGIVSADTALYADLLGRFPEHTLLRKPLVVGHRGVPSLYPENTLEGAQHAWEQGADAIENDIYLTTDNHVVIMHDGTVDRTTDGTGNIEEMTLEQVKTLNIEHDSLTGLKVPTLNEFFEAFKGKPVIHFVEIKSGKPEIIDHLKTAIDEYGVADQVVVISFSDSQLLRMREIMPEVTVGYLNSVGADSDLRKSLRRILSATQTLSSTFNPSYGSLNNTLMEAAKHRGTTFWPWTFRDQTIAETFYTAGTHGLTTDYAQWFSAYPVSVATDNTQVIVNVGETAGAPITLTLQDGRQQEATSNQMLVIDSTVDYTSADGQVVFNGTGSATVLLGHTENLGEGRQYRLYSAPVSVSIR
ncbi:Glycerophosphoryl diester phosphodiesterase [Alloalcanivorax xenomutans]|uniref:glycerophosphodiester phosphodiesterase family protein n=1 Tax=Alloalcanivorax xenomutans TaxID=1094342 RepID=UPI0006D5C605|nr:glycerophosphodiester phosphodiesterase family protein [Alloalcanivorax xenomutans]PHS60986.1 MAG: glycerophosphodiester phosphodiesterase [Alcanivorax sp.]CUR46799.1 Glycerophosphoryl diester phosphodiesterase [Alloalcanivorax xenomutans]